MERKDIRSDLANESLEELIEGDHYKRDYYKQNEVEVEVFEILKEHQSINQGIGTYVEISFKDYLQQETIIEQLTNVLEKFINKLDYPRILIMGLGNQYLTNDAIGPRSVRDIRVTHFLEDEQRAENQYYDILALAPGVMVQTGMESSDITNALIDKEDIDLIIVVDALCAKNYDKLSHVIQVNNVGINPGGGIGNHRKAINKQSSGIDVIAIGVPTVIYASSVVNDVIKKTVAYFGDSLNPTSKLKIGKRDNYQGELSNEQKEVMLGQIGKLDEKELEALFNEVLNPIESNYIFSDKAVDEQCEILSKIIAKSINNLKYNKSYQ